MIEAAANCNQLAMGKTKEGKAGRSAGLVTKTVTGIEIRYYETPKS